MTRRLAILAAVVSSVSACRSDVVVGIFNDPLVTDAGPADAGDVDAGVRDAGPNAVDLALTVRVLWVTEVDAGPAAFDVTLQNAGSVPASDVRLDLSWTTSIRLISSPDCLPSGVGGSCELGLFEAGASRRLQAEVALGDTPLWFPIGTRAVTSSEEPNRDNNYAPFAVALTQAGVTIVPIDGERAMTFELCPRPEATTFALCPQGLAMPISVAFHADGGIEDTIPMRGFWGQSPHRRNVAFRFMNPDGTVGTSFVGGSIGPGCFEGTFENGFGGAIAGSWRGCLR